MRLLLILVASIALTAPYTLGAQPQDTTNAWALAGGLGVGVADVPYSLSPLYFDATQVTAHLKVQRSVGGGLYGGAAMLATLGNEGSDCVGIGPCAPPFLHHAAQATLSYVHRNSLRKWIPVASLGAGVARLPAQGGGQGRTPAATTLLLSGAVDVPLIVGARSAFLAGWESSVLPNVSGGRVYVNTLSVTVRLAP